MSIDEETTFLHVEDEEGCSITPSNPHYAADHDDIYGSSASPMDWPTPFKWRTVAMLAFAAFTVSFNCISIFPIAKLVVHDLAADHVTKADTVLMVTIWELGEAVGALLIAPLSEMFGRYYLYNACNLVFIMGATATALSQSTTMFILARALTGMAVAPNVLNPAIIGDIYPSEQRGSAMSVLMLATLAGGNLGPALGGIISQTLGWRAVVWIGVALAVACELVFLMSFKETYRAHVPQRDSAKLLTESSYAFDGTVGLDKNLSGLRTAVMRPARLLYGSGVLACLALFGSVIFSFFYDVLVTLPRILEETYDLSPAAVGSSFLANGIGSFIGIMISKMYLDKIYVKLRAANNGVGQPEYRLPVAIIGAFMLPPAVALYGWCAETQLPLTLLLLSVVAMRLSLMLAIVPLMTYIVDAFGLYSASAMSGVIVLRCLACAFLSLSTVQVTEYLGDGWGFTLLGAVCMVLALIPVMILRYGQHWRQRCRYTSLSQDSTEHLPVACLEG